MPPGILCDRLGAALAGICIGDRWSQPPSSLVSKSLAMAPDIPRPRLSGQVAGGVLQVAAACATGDPMRSPRWQAYFQGLACPLTVAVHAFPHLWLSVDAHGHHRGAVEQWTLNLALSPAATAACGDLFALLCHTLAGHRSGVDIPGVSSPCGGVPQPLDEPQPTTVGQVLTLVNDSQGQLAVALAVAQQRGWGQGALALVGLLTAWTGGRASLHHHFQDIPQDRPQDRPNGDPDDRATAAAIAAELEGVVTPLYRRWAGAIQGQPQG